MSLAPDCGCKQGIMASTSEKRLENKVIIVTGGASGIGEASCKLFAANGAFVIIADVNDEGGHKVAMSIGPRAHFFHCDVTKEEDIENVISQVMALYGRLDALFNNAGVCTLGGNLEEQDMQEFDKIMNVNVRGTVMGMKHASRVMIPAKKGCIINTSSVASVVVGMSSLAYVASKHAVVGVTKAAAAKLGPHGIRVNCISPYGVPTPLFFNAFKSLRPNSTMSELENLVASGSVLQGHILTAEDIARSALFLISDDASYISGHNLIVDGATTISGPVGTRMNSL